VKPKASMDGPLAAAIPGLPAGLVHMSQKYGRLPLKDSLAPAIRLARNGWTMNHKTAALLPWRGKALQLSPGAMELFFRNGEPIKAGETLKNPAYARTLELLAKHGHDGFYRGELAKKLVRGVRRAGGIWSEEDLAQYHVVEREPLRFSHRGFQLVTAPPPSSGGIALAEIFNILDGYEYTSFTPADRLHVTVEAMRRAYRDRAEYLGDPDFTQVPVRLLMSPEYAAGLRATIHPSKATPSELLPPVDASTAKPDTTHFSVLDTEGNLAAVTQTVNLTFGNAFAVPDTGFVLNDEMDDFSAAPGVPNAFGLVGGEANAIEPGKRPLSSMTPTLLFGEDRIAAIGTPGGSRIITMVLLGLEALMEGKGAQAAADAPRYHHQYLPDMVFAEPSALPQEQIEALQARGHAVRVLDDTWGNMNIVLWNVLTGEVEAGSDSRNEGVGKGALSAPAAIYR
jgi:gamma-glutamyltranspeptidase/glutathione hydrolase